ncbi:MAG TPA: hypothetical protein PLR99_15115 [Polyangiaceae bacterium]|nr:hypothetical protein [Polyangiaceae bacterium]
MTRTALTAFAALASLASLAACASSGASTTSDKHLDVSQFQKVCLSGVGDLKPTPPVDYLAIVVSGGGEPTPGPAPAPVDAGLDAGSPDGGESDAARPPAPSYGNRTAFTGVPCASATNRAACEAKVVAASAPRGPTAWSSNDGYSGGARPPEPSYAHYVYTRGDEVGALTTRDELVRFLAPIENVAEAVETRGPYGDHCATVRSDPEGFAFFEVACRGSSDYPFETITLVLRDGSTRELARSQPKDRDPGTCAPKP